PPDVRGVPRDRAWWPRPGRTGVRRGGLPDGPERLQQDGAVFAPRGRDHAPGSRPPVARATRPDRGAGRGSRTPTPLRAPCSSRAPATPTTEPPFLPLAEGWPGEATAHFACRAG